MGPIRPSLIDKGLQEMSSGENATLQDSPLQKIYSGNALSTQGALGLSISAQESLGHSPSAQGSPDTSLSSQHALCPCLDQGPLGHLSADSGEVGISDFPHGTPKIAPFTQSTLERPYSTHWIIEAFPTSQDDLRFPPPSVQTLQPS